jgi:TonB-linked SusC/RagA family outer membrane protein
MTQYNKLLKGGLFLFILLFIVVGARAQQITVHGTVKDAQTGDPLPGVNILVVGTSTGTATDPNGAYELTPPSGSDTLRFSFIGYKTQNVPIDERTTINISLSPTILSGNQMIVTGYLEQTKKDVIGSVSTVSSEDLQQANTVNVTNMLQGKAAGVYIARGSGEPGTAPTVLIRGKGSISAGGSPLYIIDGVISNYNAVSPQDIKSLTVLKGPVATAIYGSRAANGAIEITTKSGGSQNGTNFDISIADGVAHALKGNLHYMNGAQFRHYYKELGLSLPDYVDTKANTNWWDVVYQPAVIQKYHASASGGGEQSRFYVSGNLYKNGGTRIGSEYTRFSGSANYQRVFSDKFTIDARINGHYVKKAQVAGGAGLLNYAAYIGIPWDKPYNKDGTPRKGIVGKNWLTRDIHNPIYVLHNSFDRNRNYYFSIQPKLSYDFTDYLTLTSNNHFDVGNNLSETYLSKNTLTAGDINGSINNNSDNSSTVETSDLLTYKRQINKHNINAVVGFEYQEQNGWNFGATGAGIGDFDVLGLAANPYAVDGSKYKVAFVSQFLQMKYNYNDTYYFAGSFRRDGSSRFGSKKHYGNFYAVGGSWMVSNEPFFHANFVDQLRLRLGYGITGNAQIGNYAAQSLQSYGIKYNGVPGSYPSTLGNPALTWEKQHDWQIGMDLKLFGSRLNVTIDGYQKKDIGLLQAVPLPYVSGFTSQLQNIGTVRNRGLEVTISTVNIRSGDFHWTMGLNATYNKNKVLKLYQNKPIINDTKIIKVGSPINTWYMPKWAGVNPKNGKPQWEQIVKGSNGKKQVELTSDYNKATYQEIGASSIPKWYGGINSKFQFKGFSLYTQFTYMGGYQVYGLVRVIGGAAQKNQLDLGAYPWKSRWKKPGDHATEPKLVLGSYGLGGYKTASSTHLLYNGNHIRLKELRLAYQIPASISKRLNLSMIKIYMDGENLWTHTAPHYIGPDPEESLDANEGARTKYPNSRTFMFGIHLKF